MKRKENIYQIYTKLLFPQFPKKNTYLNYNYRHKKNHNYQIVRGFTVTLSRSRVVNYSRPKGIENATSLLRCVPANPFLILPLPLSRSVSLYRLVDSNIRRRNGGRGGKKREGEGERKKRRRGTCWLEFR